MLDRIMWTCARHQLKEMALQMDGCGIVVLLIRFTRTRSMWRKAIGSAPSDSLAPSTDHI